VRKSSSKLGLLTYIIFKQIAHSKQSHKWRQLASSGRTGQEPILRLLHLQHGQQARVRIKR
jgi:hypothetical protein